jgi:AcrR family transcriptional regulator
MNHTRGEVFLVIGNTIAKRVVSFCNMPNMATTQTTGQRARSGPRSEQARSAPRAPGRPRSEHARAAILRAAIELLQSNGFSAMSVDAIAARAGVGKATIYRWWPNKAAVVMDAFLADTAPGMPFPDTGSTREDLRRQMRSVIRLFNTPAVGGPFVALIGESQHDPALAAALRERFVASRRAAAKEVLRRGVERGELRPDLDLEVAMDALYGPLYYRLLVSGQRLTPRYADLLLDQIYPALTPR